MAVTAEAIAELAERTLGRPVGPADDLFRAGFSSALLVRLWASIGESLQVRVPVGVMFSAPTPRSLAARITELAASARPVRVTAAGRAGPAAHAIAHAIPPTGTGPASARGMGRREAREALERLRGASAAGPAAAGPRRSTV
ncbi:acyl carrier protein [Actinomadura verrucosospora]|uniref:acyl carrier protein n=1 Tax=Actinomadura verrucosospora TaxID=46165 RepID=UPI00156417EF|nr:acyl carrier protein [Actinomadura verrucosospora]